MCVQITKYNHSCLVVEENEKTILLDPGNYSYETHVLDLTKLKSLDALGITHEHMDHMHIPWIQEILARFPKATIITTKSAVKILQKENITATSEDNEYMHLEPIPHEKIWMGNPVENVMITLFGKFATPGDSFAIKESPEILALPLQGPWGSMEQAVELALRVKPKTIIPIHDFHLKDEFCKQYYQRLHDYFAQHSIDFKMVETGGTITV